MPTYRQNGSTVHWNFDDPWIQTNAPKNKAGVSLIGYTRFSYNSSVDLTNTTHRCFFPNFLNKTL